MKSPLAVLLVVLVAAAVALFFFNPWGDGDGDPGPKPQDGPIAGTDARASLAKAADATRRNKAAQDAAAWQNREKIELPVHTSLRGTLLGPEGVWPGAGDVQLVPASDKTASDPMSLLTMGMEQARKAQQRALEGVKKKKKKKKKDRPDKMLRLLGLVDPVASAEVDGGGGFVLNNPPEGRFELRLDHPYLAIHKSVVVEIRRGSEQDLGVIPTRAMASLMVLAFDSEGHPVSGAHLEVYRRFDTSAFMNPTQSGGVTKLMRRMIPKSGTTDARGAFLFKGLDPNETWFLRGTKSGFTDAHRVIHLQPAIENLLQLEMFEGASLRLTIALPDGKPCPRARVSIEFPDYEYPEGFAARMGTDQGKPKKSYDLDSTGTETLRGLREGRAIVHLNTPGFLRQRRELTLAADGETQSLEFRLEEGAVVTGKITGETGQPLRKALILPFGTSGSGPLGFDLTNLVGDMLTLEVARRGIPVDDQGSFRVGGLAPNDSCKLVAVAPGHDSAEQIAKAGARDIEIQLRKFSAVRGRVLAAKDGTPVESFEVKLVQKTFMVLEKNVAREEFSGRTDGSFVLVDAPRDRFTVAVEAAGFSPFTSSVDLRSGEVDVGEIRLLPASSLVGIVLDPQQSPVADAAIRIMRGGIADTMAMASGLGGADAKTDEHGRFKLDQLHGRRVRLLVDKEGYAALKSRPIALERGDVTEDVVLELAEGGSIHGVLVDADDKPLAGWRAQASHTGGVGVRVGKTDQQGEFVLEGLAPGTQKVDCMPSDYANRIGVGGSDPDQLRNLDLTKIISRTMKWVTSDRVVVEAGKRAEIKLTFTGSENDEIIAGTVRVEGRVRVGDEDLASGLVFLSEVGATAQGPVSRVENGRFTVSRIEPGRYRCRVQAGLMSGSIGRPTIVEIRDAEDRVHPLEVVLPAGGLAGRVLTGEDRAAAGIVLSISSSGEEVTVDRMDLGEGTVLTDKNGGFHFRGLSPGRYSIFGKEAALRRGGATRFSGSLADIDIGPAETRRDLVIRLSEGGTVEVHVLDERGPRRNAIVTLLDSSGQPVSLYQRALTDSSGVVQIAAVPAGEYRVAVDAPRVAATISDPFTVTRGATQRMDVTLEKGIQVTVTVAAPTDSTKTGSDSVLYTIWNKDGARIRSGQARIPKTGTTWPIGRFTPGTYRVRLESRRFGILVTQQNVPTTGQANWIAK